jgi:DNA-cytosine methyltransferase
MPVCRKGPAAAMPVCRKTSAAVMPVCRKTSAAVMPVCRKRPAAEMPVCRKRPAAEMPVCRKRPAAEMPVCRKMPAADEPDDTVQYSPWHGLSRVPLVTCIGGLRIGSDFSAVDTPAWALKVLDVSFEHIFSCDKFSAAGKIASHLEVKHKYSDITTRPDPPDVDLYVFGPPCQAFSRSGKQLGATDPVNGTLTLQSLMYIAKHKPPMILMEQVPAILQEKHKELWELVLKALKDAGYHLTFQVFNSMQFGVPQRRTRLYLAGALRAPVVFELPPRRITDLSMIVKPLPPSLFCMVPSLNEATRRQVKIIKKHLATHTESGTNVFMTPVVISAGHSEKYAHSSMSVAMTVTKTEAARRGYWCTTKGGFLDADEIALLQGFPVDLVPWRALQLSENQFCGMIGNAMTLPVVVCLLPSLLRAGGKVDVATACELHARARNFRPVE